MNKPLKIIISIFSLTAAFAIVILVRPSPAAAPQTPLNPPVEEKSDSTSIFFGGDIMLSRNVARKIYTADDYALPFEKIKNLVASTDISFANLESPFNDEGQHFIEGSLVFNADPKSVAGLTQAGFDVLSTANNHTLDQGVKGMDFTLNHLAANGIKAVGTLPPSLDFEPVILQNNGTSFGFLAYSYTAYNDGGSKHPRVKDFNNLEQLKLDISNLKQHPVDVVIVSMHAGTEYTREPTQKQIDFARAAIDAGADLVIGHHPHWIQTVEQYRGKWIFYSLGNLVFDQMWSEDTREGLTLIVIYKNSKIEKIELKPVIIEDYCCPRWADPEESRSILGKLGLTDAILMDKN